MKYEFYIYEYHNYNLFKIMICWFNMQKNCIFIYNRFKNFVTKNLKLVEIDSDIKE